MITVADLDNYAGDAELHVQVRLDGPDAWSHHVVTGHELREQPDGTSRLVLIVDPPPPDDEPEPAAET